MLADLKPDLEDPGYIVRANGQNTVQIAVEKRSGANSVGVSRALRAALPKIESSVPFAVDFHVDEDEGHDLQQKLEELVVRSFVILGLLFLLIIISLRRVQLTSIVMASIFFAVVISFSFFYFVRISVNFITISAIAICFGIIVDNSILVLDEVHRRLESLARADEAGLSRRTKLKIAARTIIEACRAVTFPIFATTLATVVVFLSFIFLSGRLAVYYVPLGVAVATAMAASLFVALGWLPVALNQGWAASVVRRSKDGAREIDDAGALAAFVEEQPDLTTKLGFLERLWDWTQRLWWIVLPATTALVIWSGFLYKNKVIKGGFWRLPNEEELFLYLEMPAGTDINVTSETLAGFEAALLPIPEGARMRATTFGNQAVLRVEFDDKMLRTEYPTMYRTLLVEEADRTGGISIFIRGFADQPYFKGAFGGSALNSLVKISGYNSKRLNDIAETALADIQRQRRVRNARLTTGAMWERANQEETVILLNRDRLAEENVSAVEIIGHLRRLIGVDIPWTMLIEGDQVRVQLAFDDSETLEYSDLTEKRITTPSGAEVRLGDLVTVETRPLSGPITRDDQRYTVNLNWEYVGTDKMRQAYIKHVLAGLSLPYGYEAEEGQQEFFTQEEEEELTLTLVLALVFIYIVLAALFESVTLPILVLMSVPLGLVGVIVAYWLTHTTFDSSARIGLVLLFGVVVNNAILLVNRIQTESSLILRAKLGGDPEREAAIFPGLRKTLGGSDLHALDARERGPLLRRAVARAMRSRLRSIYLTTSTTVIGLVPLLFTLRFKDGRLVLPFRETEGGEIWENLALTSIGGLLSSTVLILICLPPLYYASVRAWWGVRRLARRRGTSDRITRQR
jgi:HAE1 family hydrophobic/amphiphilic exporter-1